MAQALARMPLLPYARAERWRIESAAEKTASKAADHTPEDWAKPYPPAADTYLEVAAWYRTLGDVASSDAVLHSALSRLPGSRLLRWFITIWPRMRAKQEG